MLRRMALLAATLLLTWTCLEVAIRLSWTPRKPPLPDPIRAEWRELPEIDSMFEMAQANVRGRRSGVLFETNSHGFRGPERRVKRPPSTTRIAIAGDSIAMGEGVEYEDSYGARLERALVPRSRGHRYEVLNVSLSGLNTIWAMRRLKTHGLKFQPQIVVYGYTLNDIESEHYRRSVDQSFIDPRRFQSARLHLWRLLGPRWASLQELLWAPKGSYVHELRDNYYHNPEAWALVEAGLDDLAELTTELEACTVLFVHTRLNSLGFLHPYHEIYERVIAAGSERGFHGVNSYSLFAGQWDRELWIRPFDTHPNAEGHRLLSEALLDGLRGLPAQCWGEGGEPELR